MTTSPIRLAAALLLALAALPAAAAGGLETPAAKVDPDLARAQKALDAKEWDEAIRLLGLAAGREPKNADVHNLLGFAERKRGNLDAAFGHYRTALELDPKHKGAHEYAGEAWLLAGNLAKAEEHLAALDKICFFSCEEYRDLKKAIAEWKQAHPQ